MEMEDYQHAKIIGGQASSSSSSSSSSSTVPGRVRVAADRSACNRERMARHWEEVAGRVTVPDEWGHESVLDEWVDCSTFDELLAPLGVVSARRALVRDQGRRGASRDMCRSSLSLPLPSPQAPAGVVGCRSLPPTTRG